MFKYKIFIIRLLFNKTAAYIICFLPVFALNKTFTTTYSYTKIGHIVDSSQSLPQALGDGDVTVSFGHDETAISTIRVDEMSDNIYYTIDGRVVTNPGPGIYIHKGKKIKL